MQNKPPLLLYFNEDRLEKDGVERLLRMAYMIRKKNFPDIIYFYNPGMIYFNTPYHKAINPYRFPAISITGKICYLNCEHCRGKLLETMLPALNPNDLFRICLKIKRKGGTGCLISGGCLKDGKVPLMKYISVIKQIKEKLKLKVVVHTGLVTHSIAEALASANVDGVMLDIIGANETIKRIYHLNHKVEDFENALAILEQHNIPTIPHIVVGLHFGRIKGQKKL